ncbi:hypothetical protein SEENIN0B_02835 [Salmonella enterica subsp. enterica serovar Infantis str. SARB27]|uniref:Uncharacterized protein n=1 Tax=Salmonella enterica subsp. enterica serovar Infantis str. SARB27 TaxID=596155 RepID=A0A6C8GB70_SALIN|nr:hypothetical protein SEENIN0B_02835 [Salmonella enterica subsp. enterica serovar Infantis str. SARB27]
MNGTIMRDTYSTSSGETIYALSNGLCSSRSNIFSRNFLLP